MSENARFTLARTSSLAGLALIAAPVAAQICGGPVHGEPFVVTKVFEAGGALYATGALEPDAWLLARYDGSQWTLLPGTFDAPVECLAQTTFGLIAGGEFGAIDGAPHLHIARFDGQAWQVLAGGIDGATSTVLALHEHEHRVYAAGKFASASGVQSANIASWDGNAWNALLGGTDGEVRALASYAEKLIVGGDFDSAGGLELHNVAQWDGLSWSSLGSALAPVWDLEVSGTRLYAASGALQLLTDGTWQPLGAQLGIDVRSVAIAPSGIYVHGPWIALCLAFNNGPCLQRARFSAGQWTQLGFDEFDPSLDSLSLAAFEGAVYETGDTDGLRVYSSSPKLHSWSPSHGPWYGTTQLTLSLSCLDAQAPAQAWIDDQPLATSIVGPSSVSVSVPGNFTDATGPLDLRFEQGGASIVVPGGFVSRPSLAVQTFALFAQNIKFRVHSTSGSGTAWILISGQEAQLPLALPGIHALLDLDPVGGSVLGAGALAPDSALPATLGFVLPLGTIPPGLKFRAQSFVAEQTTSGLRLAFTNAVDVVAP